MARAIKRITSVTERDLALTKLTQDTIDFDLDVDAAMEYIARRYGRPISQSTFYKFKKKARLTESSARERMFQQAKTGFVIKHFEIMDIAETVSRNLSHAMWSTLDNPLGKAALARELKAFLELLRDLNVGSPIIETIRQEAESKVRQITGEGTPETKEDEANKDAYGNVPPSALVLPDGFIDSSLYATDDGGRMAAGKKPSDRVF